MRSQRNPGGSRALALEVDYPPTPSRHRTCRWRSQTRKGVRYGAGPQPFRAGETTGRRRWDRRWSGAGLDGHTKRDPGRAVNEYYSERSHRSDAARHTFSSLEYRFVNALTN